MTNIFPEILDQNGISQLRIAETEKYAHVTYFFNGGVEALFHHEERILIKSPKVATYDLQPEMSALEVTEEVLSAIRGGKYEAIIMNFANPDMVGHTGNIGQANYAASKSGMLGMTKSLAIEYAKKNITLNCVSPGFIQSNMTDKILESIKAVLTSKIPMSKLGSGEDVANTVAFLSSDAASYITGETIHVNGGMYMA